MLYFYVTYGIAYSVFLADTHSLLSTFLFSFCFSLGHCFCLSWFWTKETPTVYIDLNLKCLRMVSRNGEFLFYMPYLRINVLLIFRQI